MEGVNGLDATEPKGIKITGGPMKFYNGDHEGTKGIGVDIQRAGLMVLHGVKEQKIVKHAEPRGRPIP